MLKGKTWSWTFELHLFVKNLYCYRKCIVGYQLYSLSNHVLFNQRWFSAIALFTALVHHELLYWIIMLAYW